MRVGSLFAGVGGFDLGFQRAGMTTAWAVEIDKQARGVFRHHFPNAEVYEDVREVGNPPREQVGLSDDRGSCQSVEGGGEPFLSSGDTDAGKPRRTLEPVQLLCGGFPCQDYSVAGKRGGLVGDRGALWWEFHRLIAELRPEWIVGENVPGLLSSSGGEDFATILSSLVGWDVPPPPSGWGNSGLVQGRPDHYGVVFAVVDSQFFGVAQRRRRLFIVGHSGGQPRPEILAFPEGLFGHPAPSREAGESPTDGVEGGTGGSGGFQNTGHGWWNESGVAAAIRTAEKGGGAHEANVVLDNHGAYPLAFGWNKSESQTMRIDGETTDALQASETSNPAVIAWDPNQITSKTNRSNPTPGLCHTLPVGAHAPAVANTVPSKYRGDPHEGTDTIVGAIPRRLTPTECERLQGFPDGWTNVDGMKDGPRYRMMGNAVTVPVIEWIGNRIMEHDNSTGEAEK